VSPVRPKMAGVLFPVSPTESHDEFQPTIAAPVAPRT
jgi:hypothetical protein